MSCCRFIDYVYLRKPGDAIANNKLNIEKLKNRFQNKESFKTKDLLAFYNEIETGIKKSTVNWRVYSLVQMGAIDRIGRGKFVIGKGRKFLPEISYKLINIHNKVKKKFPFIITCIWNTSVLNEFMQHQPGRFYNIIEVEKEVTQSLFYFLKDLKYPVFIEPTSELLINYLPYEKESIVIKSLVSEAPTQLVKKINTITLEKLLVDIFCDELLFSAQQGFEMQTIFKKALKKYSINENKMFRYSDRRGKKNKFKLYLNSITKLWQ